MHFKNSLLYDLDDIESRLSRARRERRREEDRERLRLEAKERERERLLEEKRKRDAEERRIREKIEKRRYEKELREKIKREKEDQKREKKRREKQRKEEEARKQKAEIERAARKAKQEAEELRKKAEKKKQRRPGSRMSKRSQMGDSDEDNNLGRQSQHSRRSSLFDNLNSDNEIEKMNYIKEETSRPNSRTSNKSKSIAASIQLSEDEAMPSIDSDSSNFNAYEKLRIKQPSQSSDKAPKKSTRKKSVQTSSSSSDSESDSDSDSDSASTTPKARPKSRQTRKSTSEDSKTSDSEQSIKDEKLSRKNVGVIKDNSSIKQAESGVHSLSEYRWGFSAEEAYTLALQFYRKNVDKAFTPQYSQKVHLHALMKLIFYGPCK